MRNDAQHRRLRPAYCPTEAPTQPSHSLEAKRRLSSGMACTCTTRGAVCAIPICAKDPRTLLSSGAALKTSSTSAVSQWLALRVLGALHLPVASGAALSTPSSHTTATSLYPLKANTAWQ